jgi:alpha-beta hydrolase superfamily lysophospholipase
VERVESRLETKDGPIFALKVRAQGDARGAVVLTHGAGSPGSATWDLPEVSMMKALARAGFDAYAFDARGFGGSFRPPSLDASEPRGTPVVRASDVQADLARVVAWARAEPGRPPRRPVHLVGWSWGCVVAGLYASRHPADVDRLVLFAPVWNRVRPSRHIRDRIWREETRALHAKLRDPERDPPAVHRAFVDSLFRFAPGDTLRLPNGPYRDLYGPDGPVWRAGEVRVPTLVIRGTRDGASTREHSLALFDALEQAPFRRYVELSDADHFAFRRRGHQRLSSEIIAFLAQPGRTDPE